MGEEGGGGRGDGEGTTELLAVYIQKSDYSHKHPLHREKVLIHDCNY